MSTSKKKAGGGFQSFGMIRWYTANTATSKGVWKCNRVEFSSIQGCSEERVSLAYSNSAKGS